MSLNDKLLKSAAAAAFVPSEHFGVMLYEGDGSSSHSINGGKFGAGAYFAGSGNITPSGLTSDQLGPNGEMSISWWMNTPINDTTVAFICEGDTDSEYMVHLGGSNTRGMRIAFAAATTNVLDVNNAFTANTWQHFVAIMTPTGNKLYRDGSLVGSNTFSETRTDFSTFYIGSRRNSSLRFEGKLDQLRIFAKELSSSEVSTLYAETASTVESLSPLGNETVDTLQVLGDTSCLALYKFENDETDVSGNYNGTGSAIQYAAGRYGQSAQFNGSSKVDITGFANFLSTGVSISAWVNVDSFSNGPTVVNLYSNNSIVLGTNSSGNFFRSGQGNTVTSTTAMTTGTWNHIVMAADTSGNVNLYLNGIAAGSGSAGTAMYNDNNNNDLIGAYGTLDQPMNGRIDQVRIFNKQISSAEVTTLYNENSLVASYRFDGNSNDDMRTYNGTDTNVTYEYGLGFTPDFIWTKSRTNTNSHALYDSTRGVNKELNSNSTDAEGSLTDGISSFDAGGFTVGARANSNQDGQDFVGWCLKANGGTTSSNTDGTITSTVQVNEQAGFSIVSYTGNGTASSTIGHGLSEAPDIVLVKARSAAYDWQLFSKEVSTATYPTLNGRLALQSTAAAIFDGYTVSVGASTFEWTGLASTFAYFNQNNITYIAYCFKNIDGFSKFGTYTGNGSANGPIVETGFEPAFLLIKPTNITGHWRILDNKRNQTNPRNSTLKTDESEAETTHANEQVDFLSNGFQLKTAHNGRNGNGDNYIYMAFAADPDTEAPTVAKSFSTVTYTGTGSAQTISGLGFSPNFVWLKHRNNPTAHQHNLLDTVRSNGYTLHSNSNSAAESAGTNMITSYTSDGFVLGTDNAVNQSGINHVAWAWKADDNEPTIFGGPAIAVYKFEDNANDVTGTYNATATNVTYSSSGKFNKAAEFNGSSSKINLPNNPIGTNLKGSVSLWVSGSSLTNTATSVNTIFYNTNPYIVLDTYDSNLRLTVKDSSSSNTTISYATSNFNATDWYHIAYVFNGTSSTFELFVNGSSVGTATAPSSTTNVASAGYIGHGGNYQYFTGKIDQVRFYNGSFKAEQVDELYAETVSQNDDLTLGGPPEILISANANAGFSIVKWEGTGTQTQIPHGLSAVPEMIISKRFDSTNNWSFYHKDLGLSHSTYPNWLYLNLTSAEQNSASSANHPYYARPSATVIYQNTGTSESTNVDGGDYISYCFHSVSGYSKFGTYTGTGTGTNQLINTGFQPDWVMFKDYSAGGSWWIQDSVRGSSISLKANASNTESTTNYVTFESNGFRVSGDANGTSSWIYWAIKIN